MVRLLAIETLFLALPLYALANNDSTDAARPSIPCATVSKLMANPDAGTSFRLEGDVISRVGADLIIFRDGTGGLFAQIRDKTPCRPGQRIRATATARIVRTSSGKPRQSIGFTDVETLGYDQESVVPVEIDPTDLVRIDDLDYRRVAIRGTVTDVVSDEIDPEYLILFIESKGARATVSVFLPALREPLPSADLLIDAEVSASGVFLAEPTAGRLYRGPHIANYDGAEIKIMRPAPGNPFLECPSATFNPSSVARAKNAAHRYRTAGHVTATFGTSSACLALANGENVRVKFASFAGLPPVGASIDVAGFMRSNVFFPQLDNAIWRTNANARLPAHAGCERISARYLLFDEDGRRRIKYSYDGHIISLQGRITDVLPASDGHLQIVLNADNLTFTAVAPAMPMPAIGATVEVTGACLLLDSSGSTDDFARLDGFSVILRTADDLVVISSPPWWTVRRILLVLLVVVALMVVVLVWNILLRRLAERRGRQLASAELAGVQSELKKAERTRLSAELHDSLSQSLTGIGLQLDASQHARNSDVEAADQHLEAARRMLQGCRTELRRCIWDLRSSALDDPDFEQAIRTSLRPIVCDAKLSVRSHVPRSFLSDNVAHAVLRILHELVANALRHGKATSIRIAGDISTGPLKFSVTDNGRGFPPGPMPGPKDGHFGLMGVRERLREMGGSIAMENHAPGGAKVTFVIPFPDKNAAPESTKR